MIKGTLGQNFLLVDLWDFFSDLGFGGRKKTNKKPFFFFNISINNSKTSKVNQQSVLNF